MLDRELREGHLWLQIQWIVAVVIVTLLEESVVRCLSTNHQNRFDLYNNLLCVCNRCVNVFPLPHLGETALVIQDPQYPMRLRGDEVNAGLVVTKHDVLPGDLFPAVLLLYGITYSTMSCTMYHSVV